MASDDELLKNIDSCFKIHLWKTVFSQAALFVAQMLIVSVVLVFVMALPQAGSIALSLPLMLAAGACVLLFQYGFLVIIYKIYTGKPAVIGDLLCGVRDFKRMFVAACLFIMLELSSSLVTFAVFFAVSAAFLSAAAFLRRP